jgi:hypothetical protein
MQFFPPSPSTILLNFYFWIKLQVIDITYFFALRQVIFIKKINFLTDWVDLDPFYLIHHHVKFATAQGHRK